MALLEQLKLLVNLARVDGDMVEQEKNYILNIGKANGFPLSAVSTLFYGSHQVIIPENLTSDQKFDYIFSLVQLMKIDERLYKEEIKYCARIAAKLGYSQPVMFELLSHVKSAAMDSGEVEKLKKLVSSFLAKS